MPALDRVARDCEGEPCVPLMAIRPASGTIRAGNHASELGPASAEQPGDAEHLAAMKSEADVAESRAARHSLDAEDLRAAPSRRRRIVLGDVAVGHHPHELGNRRRQRSGADGAAVAQDRGAMPDARQLLQPMRNVDHRSAVTR